ncbi:MAG: hypothetical protein IIB02_02530 [Thaumarchaeota archaeon]|nr:hypothetical protein [Nitrososphaerota archaeon]
MNKPKELEYAAKKKQESKAFKNFVRGISNDNTKASYVEWLRNDIMKFAYSQRIISGSEEYDELIKLDQEQITDFLLDWIDYKKDQGVKAKTIATKISSVEIFFDMNRKLFHRKIVRKTIGKDDSPIGGGVSFTDDDVKHMLSVTRSLRTKALIHFFASTGTRPAALIDPILKIKHLVEMPHPKNPAIQKWCYGVKIYDESRDGYYCFLTPEATGALDKYLESRTVKGEVLDKESFLFATEHSQTRKKANLDDTACRKVIQRAIELAGIKREKIGKARFDKSVIYGFRKRFNGKLKMENSVNSNIAEKLMAHKRGLDGTYLRPTREERYNEFCKAIKSISVSKEEKLKDEVKNLKLDMVKYEETLEKVNELESAVDKINHNRLNQLDQMMMVAKKMRETLPHCDTDKNEKLFKETLEFYDEINKSEYVKNLRDS